MRGFPYASTSLAFALSALTSLPGHSHRRCLLLLGCTRLGRGLPLIIGCATLGLSQLSSGMLGLCLVLSVQTIRPGPSLPGLLVLLVELFCNSFFLIHLGHTDRFVRHCFLLGRIVLIRIWLFNLLRLLLSFLRPFVALLRQRRQVLHQHDDCCRVEDGGQAERVDFDAFLGDLPSNLLPFYHEVQRVRPVLHQDERSVQLHGFLCLFVVRCLSLSVSPAEAHEVFDLSARLLDLALLRLNAVPHLSDKLLVVAELRLRVVDLGSFFALEHVRVIRVALVAENQNKSHLQDVEDIIRTPHLRLLPSFVVLVVDLFDDIVAGHAWVVPNELDAADGKVGDF